MLETTSWEQSLHQTTAEDITSKKPSKPIVLAYTSYNLKQLVELLINNQIVSVPILEENTELFLGFIDVLDIVSYLQQEWEKLSIESEEYLVNTAAMSKIFGKSPSITNIINFSAWDYPVAVPEKSSVAQIIDKICGSSKMRAHRILLTRDFGPIGVISKSDILSFAYSHLDELELYKPILVTSTVYDLGLVHACVSLQFTSKLSDVLTNLFENRVNTVALVDADSKLVADFSISDLKRMLVPHAFELFHCPVLELLTMNSEVRCPFNCGVSATLRQILFQLVNYHLHTVYVVDKFQRLVGVVSLTDIILLLKRLSFQTSD